MINLIPNTEKKKMVKSFYYRFTVVCLVVFGLSVLIGTFVMIPSYFLVRTKEDLVNKKLEAQKSESVSAPDQETLAITQDLENKLWLLEGSESDKFTISKEVVSAIVQKKIFSIKITDISYENNPPAGKKVSIEGIAPSREILLAFRRLLENDPLFKSVDLPISNFIKGSNIRFNLNLIPV
ncbi:hypothetical protein A2643_02055 [Candidatus Nomurabacteria bacterium RIFCSPHIGHO2_01_FULL_39_220]|uniref:Uncharacterized protein n=1 Tax=Candidatus Nomurabacteria bacterium RIFCSPLOWO2_02_FULL_40_67 TaxID=1801787 RepID=A0A1F6Y4W3_9BACT|nr:MAG: hypothetical protein UU01_C0010G0004 [Parcubacteria group bacterium GW2011_GWA2_40_37]KKS14219.1 MAG: hypothetical protein UU71_C0031G0004 [Parcubacteria group bacterium GW2011_GWB1_41_6]KKS72404.1 MAG: hypothetical protein UV43_C0017G0004 [Parcubacteria group bacterium GW2011_GWF2_42_7]OGI63135.1 MAG: hypothetical protein A2W12_04160 [Candidatus Nomurabacteria bacterium RBG_16_40_11]OGI69881.1 MAG: hypothetical protein A2643_02055 [Candidatus Nomurabacteria bacterium RIFCSPHIGHO2_01_FU